MTQAILDFGWFLWAILIAAVPAAVILAIAALVLWGMVALVRRRTGRGGVS